MSRLKFDEYRFHFRPEGKNIDLFTDEAMKTKNTLIKDLLESDFTIKYRGGDLKYQKHTLKNNRYHIRLANRKKAKVERNFQSAYIENEPSCNIFIWNSPNEQKIFIESDKTSFNDSKTVARILTKNINEELTGTHLNIDIRKELLETELWDLTKKYKGQIREIEFTLIYPNLPAAHKHISEELNEAQKSLGSYESVVAFKSEDDGVLKNVM